MDMNSVCRTCLLSSSEMFSLFSQLECSQRQLSEMLMACTTVQITSSEGLPELMCRSCVIDLSNAYTFKLRCEKTDLTLRQYLKDDQHKLPSQDEKESDDNFKIKLPNNSIVIQCDKCNVNFCSSESLVEHLLECQGIKTSTQEKENLKLEVLEIDYQSGDLKLENVEYIQEESVEDVKEFYESDNKCLQDDSCDEDTCQSTDDTQKQNSWLNEYYRKSGDRYICLECKASLSTIGNLHRHIKIHIKKSRNVCVICKKTFARPDTLAEHMKRHDDLKPFECEICKKTYSSKGALSTHMYTHDRLEGKIPKERLHECSYCKKCFMSNSSLIIHIRTHTKEKPFLCQTCGKGFATRGGVDLHQRRHTGERPFKCEFCGRGFAESSNLKVHIRAHTGDRPHLCSLCGKRFTRMFLLQLHTRTHTGEKPYACTDCPKAFAQQGDLAAHKRTHTGQRPHRCPLCNQGFIKSSGLKKHIQSKHANEDVKIVKPVCTLQQSADVTTPTKTD